MYLLINVIGFFKKSYKIIFVNFKFYISGLKIVIKSNSFFYYIKSMVGIELKG